MKLGLGAALVRRLIGEALSEMAAKEVRLPIQRLLEDRYSPGGRVRLGEHLAAAGAALKAGDTAQAAGALAEAVGDFKL